MAFDMMTLVNLLFALAIFALGAWNYMKAKNVLTLYVGVGFGLFAVSHLAGLAGLSSALELPLVVVRVVGYCSVILGLYTAMREEAKPKNARRAGKR
jgi:hypothetical protein